MNNKIKLFIKNKINFYFNYIKFCFVFLFLVINNTKIEIKIKKNKDDSLLIFKTFPFLTYKNKVKPKISIFIPIYNKEKYIYRCFQSIQEQTLKEIEIIAVNDHSNDDSLKILMDLAKNDNRIKIVNNDKNKGLLYSRAIGILSSSGQYLMNLDSDDELKGYNSLKYLYNKAIRYNIDIINFCFIDKKQNKKINNCNHLNIIQKQPELFFSIFNKKDKIKDFSVWNKLIKRETFLKAYEAFKKEIYNWKWNYFEDDIWSILVNRFANSKLCINRAFYIYNYNNDSLMNKRFGLIEFQNLLYRHEMYKKIFSNKENEKFLITEYIFLLNRLQSQVNYLLLLKNPKINNQIINNFRYFLKYYNCSSETRNNIINLTNSIINR